MAAMLVQAGFDEQSCPVDRLTGEDLRNNFGMAAVAGVFGLSAAALGYGFLTEPILNQPLFADIAASGTWRRLLAIPVAVAVLAAACALLGVQRRVPALLACLAGWLAIAFGIGPLAAAGVMTVSAAAIGDLIFGKSLRSRFDSGQAFILAGAAGCVVMMFVIGFSAHTPFNLPGVYAGALLLCLWLSRRRVAFYASAARDWAGRSGDWSHGDYAALAILIVPIVMTSVTAALPEQYYDALGVHLNIASTMAATGRWDFRPAELVSSVGPMGAQWIFAAGHILAGEIGAKAMNFLFFGGVLALLASEMARLCGRRDAFLLCALFASLPIAAIETATLFVENALTLLFLASFVVLARSWRTIGVAEAALLGLLLGGAALVKLHAGFFIVIVAMMLAVSLVRQRDPARAFRCFAAFGGVGLLVGIKPYLHALMLTGNPIFPFFNAFFRSPMFDPWNFTDARYTKKSAALLYQWTFQSEGYLEASNGAMGFALLLLLPAALAYAIVRRDRYAALAAILVTAYTALLVPLTTYLRYFYPLFPLCFLLAGLMLSALLSGIERMRTPIMLASAAVLVGLQAAFLPTGGWILRQFDLHILLDPRLQAAWMDGRVPQRRLIEIVNAMAGTRARVIVTNTSPVGAGMLGVPLYHVWWNPRLMWDARRIASMEDAQRLLNEHGVTHIIAGVDTPPPFPLLPEILARFTTPIARNGPVTLYAVRSGP